MTSNGRGLGRGLKALIPESDLNIILDSNEIPKGVTFVSIEKIKANENQPRKYFNEEKLNELSDSIKEHGIIQPLVVIEDNDNYIIVAGERRFRAAIIAGLKEVPVIIKDLTPVELKEIALIENLQRENLNIIEEANAYNELKNLFNMTQDEIAKKLGKSRTAIANTLRLLNLPKNVQDLIFNNKLSAGHARTVLSIEDESLREKFANLIIEKNLSVREAEKLSKTFKEEKNKEKIKTKEENQTEIHFKSIEENLKNILGTKVILKHSGKKGTIQIEYFSNEDLERIIDFFNERK